MATYYRQQTIAIKDHLLDESYSYEFHQAVKILEHLAPKLTHLGEAIDPKTEVITLSSRVCYVYPSSDIYNIYSNNNIPDQYSLHVNFIGLAGANAPLPMPYTELLMRRNQHNDMAFQDFIDIFNHRLLSIFHRIRKKHWMGLENCLPQQSHLSSIINSLNGLNTISDNEVNSSLKDSLTFNAIHYWRFPRSTTALTALINHYFSIPVYITCNKGRWFVIDADQRTRLGTSHTRLGKDSGLGTCYWDQTRVIQIQLGPMRYCDFEHFIPLGKAWSQLVNMAKHYLGVHSDFKIRLLIANSETQPTVLKKNNFLGWNTWLGSQHSDKISSVDIVTN